MSSELGPLNTRRERGSIPGIHSTMPIVPPHRRLLSLILAGLALSACTAAGSTPPPQEASAPDSAVVLVGTFHTVWGAEPTYLLTDDAGRTTTLLLDPELTRSLGGPQAIDQRRVRVVGRPAPGAEEALRVTTLELDSSQP